MKWELDQSIGFFGYDVQAKGAAQFRHKATVDIDEAVGESIPALELWKLAQSIPGTQPFSGGILDAWPAWAVDVLAVCHNEVAAIKSYLTSEAQAHG